LLKVAGFIASLKVAETVVPAFRLIERFPGETDVTVGGVISVPPFDEPGLNTISTQKLAERMVLTGKAGEDAVVNTPLPPSSPSASARKGPFTIADVKEG